MKRLVAVVVLALVAGGWLLLRRSQASEACREALGWAWVPASALILEPLRDPGQLLHDYRGRRERIPDADFQALAEVALTVGEAAAEQGWKRLGLVATASGTALVAEPARAEMPPLTLATADRELVQAALGQGLFAVGEAPVVASLVAVVAGKEADLLAARPELAALVCGLQGSPFPTFLFAPGGDWHAIPPFVAGLAADRMGKERYRLFSTFDALGLALDPRKDMAGCTARLAARFAFERSAAFVSQLVPESTRDGHHVHLALPWAAESCYPEIPALAHCLEDVPETPVERQRREIWQARPPQRLKAACAGKPAAAIDPAVLRR